MQLSEISLQRLKRKSAPESSRSGLKNGQRRGTAGGEKHIPLRHLHKGREGPGPLETEPEKVWKADSLKSKAADGKQLKTGARPCFKRT